MINTVVPQIFVLICLTEATLENRHIKQGKGLSEHTKWLPPLAIGDCLRMQNQIGHYPLKWDKTGVIIEVRQFDQYAVKVDGSGRVTLRNREFLRQVCTRQEPQNNKDY